MQLHRAALSNKEGIDEQRFYTACNYLQQEQAKYPDHVMPCPQFMLDKYGRMGHNPPGFGLPAKRHADIVAAKQLPQQAQYLPPNPPAYEEHNNANSNNNHNHNYNHHQQQIPRY